MTDFAQAASQVMTWCNELGAVSQADHVDRRYLTKQHRQANDLVALWMQQAGCKTWEDGAANLWGRYESDNDNAQRFILGSHLDTVPNGGKYDGMLGVLAPIAVVNYLHSHNIRLPFHIDIVGFGDEEGTRFGSTLLGSRALTGQWQKEWADLSDNEGITLSQAMSNFGLSFANIGNSKITNPAGLLGYLEIHIEQGPVLEDKNLPVGIVTAINGARRFWFDIEGFAGHAGTVPMGLRQDALAASAEMILAVESIAAEFGVVATVGAIENRPNGVNVISGKTRFSLDIRSEDDSLRDRAFDAILAKLESIAEHRNTSLTYTQTHSANAVNCAPELQAMLTQAINNADLTPYSLSSGAGHDAMAIADICDVAMMFVRCYKGISHHPAESIKTHDVEASLIVLHQFLLLLSEQDSTTK